MFSQLYVEHPSIVELASLLNAGSQATAATMAAAAAAAAAASLYPAPELLYVPGPPPPPPPPPPPATYLDYTSGPELYASTAAEQSHLPPPPPPQHQHHYQFQPQHLNYQHYHYEQQQQHHHHHHHHQQQQNYEQLSHIPFPSLARPYTEQNHFRVSPSNVTLPQKHGNNVPSPVESFGATITTTTTAAATVTAPNTPSTESPTKKDSIREYNYETILGPDTHSEFSSSPDSSWNSSISSVFNEHSQPTPNNSIWSLETGNDHSREPFLSGRKFDNNRSIINKKNNRAEYEYRCERMSGPVRLHVSNLPFSYGDDELELLFKPFGYIINKEVIYNSRGSKGFGFVTFNQYDAAEKAKFSIDGQIIEGRKIEVNWATIRQQSHSFECSEQLNSHKNRISSTTNIKQQRQNKHKNKANYCITRNKHPKRPY